MPDPPDTWSWYSPDRLVLVLRAWYKIAAASETGPHSSGDSTPPPPVEEGIVKKTHAVSLRPQRTNPSGGFEDLVALRADVLTAMLTLDMVTREMIWFSYVEGFGPGECARRKGLKLWRVLQMRVDGLEQMAMFLGWRPSLDYQARTQKEKVYQRKRRWETLRLVVARSLGFCPAVGPPLTPCVVCLSPYDAYGGHTGATRGQPPELDGDGVPVCFDESAA